MSWCNDPCDLHILLACAVLASAGRVPWIQCDEVKDGSKTIRTEEAIAPVSGQRAWAELTVVRSPVGVCASTARLFVDGRAVFTVLPKEQEDGHSIGVVGWSPDGRRLAAEHFWGVWGSDAGDWSVLLYDAKSGKVADISAARLVQKAKRKRPCELGANVAGWTADGRLRIEVSDWYDVGDEQPSAHCADGIEEWLYNPQTGRMLFASRHDRAGRFTCCSP